MRMALAPENICIYRGEFLPDTMQFFHELDMYHSDYEPITVDFSKCKSISAAAAVIIFAKITRCQLTADHVGQRLGHQGIKIVLPVAKDVRSFYRESGFYDAIKPGGKNKLERLWNDIHNPFKTSNNTEADLSALLKHLKSRLGKVPDKLMSALSEAYLNIDHHAYNTDVIDDLQGRWWQYTSGIKADGTFSIVLYDMGVGIPYSIRPKYLAQGHRYSHMDNVVIEYAMVRGNTRYGVNQGRGNGFSNIKKPMDINQDAKYLLVASGKGSVKYKDQKIVSSEMVTDYSYGGTLIEWCFDGEFK